MKPNGEELASFVGGDEEAFEADPATAAQAARQLVDQGVGAVLVTLGGAGACLVTAEGAWHATPPPITVVSTVGAGDSSLFGYLLGDVRGIPPAERLALAVAYGSAAASLPGTTIPEPDQTASRTGTSAVARIRWRVRPMAQMITEDLVRLDADLGSDKHEVIRALAAVVDDAGRATDVTQLADDALAREATAATGLNGGIAIPHCRSAGVDTPTLAFARLSPGVDFGAKDGPADLAFLIAAPAGGDASHLKLLAKLARALVKKEFTDSLRAATTPAEVVQLVSGVVGDEAPRPRPPPPAHQLPRR